MVKWWEKITFEVEWFLENIQPGQWLIAAAIVAAAIIL